MSIDMSQFHQVFFEECFEGLEAMESGLLSLDIGDIDSEVINTIFRAAHSIKGGSGTFGFTVVAEYTHIMETLLDEMRDGRRQVTKPAVDVLLGSVDCLREMLTSIQNEEEVNMASAAKHQAALEMELHGTAGGSHAPAPAHHEAAAPTPVAVAAPEPEEEEDEIEEEQGWKISFCPYLSLLRTGNDPVRLFREISELGELTSHATIEDVVPFAELDPEECNITWELKLVTDASEAAIKEIFSWVEDDCAIEFAPLAKPKKAKKSKAAAAPAPAPVAEAPKVEEHAPVAAPAPAAKKPPVEADASKNAAPKASSSIRVDTDKIDTLINMVGEVVITQSMLGLVGENFTMDKVGLLKRGLAQLERHTRDLQQSVMNIRMLPISFVFSRFPRLVHDISTKLDKKITLKLVGENTEVDKAVVELINDPLVHLIRNSLDHGIEMPADRIAAGKPEMGTIELKAYHRGGHIVIEIVDDGRGLDKNKLLAKAIEKGLVEETAILSEKQIFELIFMPGFSTAEQLTDISGRGVGMDVVRRNIQSLGGNIDIISELGKGTTIAIHLPLTLAILDGQSVAVGDETYIVPLVSIIESINITEKMLNKVAGKGETFKLRNEYLPIIRMREIFNVKSGAATKPNEGVIVVVEGQGALCGFLVDELLGQQQVVIKSLEANYRRVEGVSGATILGDGSVALILDVPGLVRLSVR
ncbi:MAG: chemotaxis protein CheA [Methylococcales bacterium]|nr:chemotaxis protein CheA [Methylococcales bacterium]